MFVLCLLPLCSCGNFWYDLPPEFIDAHCYKAPRGNKSLGHPGDKALHNIYLLEGLPKSDYLGKTEGSLWGSASLTSFLVMNKNVREPILRYGDNVFKFEINRDEIHFDGSITAVGEFVVIEDLQTIASMISLRASGFGKDWEDFKIDPDFYRYNSISFYFDFPCELVWESSVFWGGIEGECQLIYWRVQDVASGREICYDATEILSPLLS